MKRVLFTMLLTAVLTAGCAFDSDSIMEVQSDTDSMVDGGDGDGDGDGDGETGATTSHGDGDGDGDGDVQPIEPYAPCDPMEMMAGDNYCADGPLNIEDPDSPEIAYTCVLGTVGADTGTFCLPMFDSNNDGTSLHNGCFTPGGANRQFAGCLNLACVSSDLLPADFCENNDTLNPFPEDGWDSHCCTTYCDTDADCGPGLSCQLFGGSYGACMEG